MGPGDERVPLAGGGRASRDPRAFTNDHQRPAPDLESEHRHKAQVESGVRELKEDFGLHALRKHGFMANWAWLVIVCLGHNTCCWTQELGVLAAGRDGHDLRAKRFRNRYLTIPAMVVRTGRPLVLKLAAGYPYLAHRPPPAPNPAGNSRRNRSRGSDRHPRPRRLATRPPPPGLSTRSGRDQA